jgi:hypothetical protein
MGWGSQLNTDVRPGTKNTGWGVLCPEGGPGKEALKPREWITRRKPTGQDGSRERERPKKRVERVGRPCWRNGEPWRVLARGYDLSLFLCRMGMIRRPPPEIVLRISERAHVTLLAESPAQGLVMAVGVNILLERLCG